MFEVKKRDIFNKTSTNSKILVTSNIHINIDK